MERGDNTVVLDGEVEYLQEEKNNLHLKIELENASAGTVLELPYLYYPGYRVILQSGDTEYNLDTEESQYGMMCITIPEDMDEGTISVDYTATSLDKASYIISGISLISFIGYIIWFKKANKEEKTKNK